MLHEAVLSSPACSSRSPPAGRSALQPQLHVGLRQPQRVGCLRGAHLLQFTQHQHGPVSRGQRQDGTFQQAAPLEKSTEKDHLRVNVTGTQEGNVIHVQSLSLL